MKLYRVECNRDSDFSATYWTMDLKKVQEEYENNKDAWYDDEAFEDDKISLVEIEVPEEVFEEFEDDSKVLQEHILCVELDDEEEDGYVSSYWHTKVPLEEEKK